MLIGFVSDENYLAIADAQLELRNGGEALVLRSAPSGAVYGDLTPGNYEVLLSKHGFGSKRIRKVLLGDHQYQFRLLSNRMLGYAWPSWAVAGSNVEFRVHSPEPYRIVLWRYGLEKKVVRNIGWYDEHGPRAVTQTLPDGHFVEHGVKWYGGKMPSHSQMVEVPETTGLYYFHVKTESKTFFSFPLVVAPAKPTSKIAVLASTNTWNAYNSFGGRSNYVYSLRSLDRPTVDPLQDLPRYNLPTYGEWKSGTTFEPLSFDRPNPANMVKEEDEVTDPIEGRDACHLAPSEWRTLGWMERQGISYDLYSDYDLHSGRLSLDQYKILVLNTHPEYWSSTMYKTVKCWVHERAGRLVYLGGNGINGPVEFLNESTMRCINHWPNNSESRFHSYEESEANLLGVVFSDPGAMTSAPYRVIQPDHWIFDGTGLKEGDSFGDKTLHERCPNGASGHETDKISPSSPPNISQLAKGLNPNDGGADMIFYESQSGGLVFSAGSICFPTALLVDEHCSQIIVNVIQRFLR